MNREETETEKTGPGSGLGNRDGGRNKEECLGDPKGKKSWLQILKVGFESR